VRVFIGLGGNLGDPEATFRGAVAQLRLLGQVVHASSLYAAAPRDLYDQPEFRNAAVEIEIEMEARPLLLELKQVELQLGRDPQGRRFGPRVIDLDILVIDGRCVEDLDVDLIVPHPRLPERRFVLEPLAELDPDLRPWRNCADLRRDVTVADLLPSVADQDVRRVGGPEWADPVSEP
jgi:2-amino-4-hydroxy-6-hydroxymethyldihydropteridine diphosphokinase